MKYLNKLVFVLIASLFVTACCKTSSTIAPPTEITFDVPFTDTGYFKDSINNPFPITIPGASYTYKLTTGVTAGLAANNMKKENVTSAKGDYLRVIIETPADQYFDFIDSMRIYFAPLSDSNNKTLVATKYTVPTGSKTLDMDMVDVELKDFLLQDSLYMIIKGDLKPLGKIKKGTLLRFNANFKVKGHL